MIAYREAARRLERNGSPAEWLLAPLAVTFANEDSPAVPGEPICEPPNLHERTRTTCRLCGECDIGCNYGAKNTLDYNYLTDAWKAEADLRTSCEVRGFEPAEGGGYLVHYVTHDVHAEGHRTDTKALPLQTLSCRHLVLSAGTLGTTWLMLRNSHALPGLSSTQLGAGFSGNGDLLSFALHCTKQAGGGKREPLDIDPAHGPVITSAIRMPDALDGGAGEGRGFYLEDAGYPEFASWMLETLETPDAIVKAIPRLARYVWSVLHGRRHSEIGGLASALLGSCELSSSVLPLLGMGRDVPNGQMRLQHERLELAWSKDGPSGPYFDRVRDFARELAHELGAKFEENPIWYEDRVITVHSLGGCRMGRTPQQGVVDPMGNVFGHPGLHIADGSVMPGPVGANPSLTIAALADRFADAMLDGGGAG